MRFVLLLTAAVFAGISVSAQIVTLRGTVTDENGAVVVGATVTGRSSENVLFETQTDVVGAFLASVRQRQVSIEIKATCLAAWKLDSYRVPETDVADLGSIVLKADKNCPTIDEFPIAFEPVESGKPFLSTEILSRPAPPLPLRPPTTRVRHFKRNKSPRSPD